MALPADLAEVNRQIRRVEKYMTDFEAELERGNISDQRKGHLEERLTQLHKAHANLLQERCKLRDGPAAASISASTGGGAAGIRELLSPTRALHVKYALCNAGSQAIDLASHASRCGLRGQIRHLSMTRSDFDLVAEVGGEHVFNFYFNLVNLRVPLEEGTEDDAEAFSDACAVITSDRRQMLTSDPALVAMLRSDGVEISFSSEQLRLDMEAARDQEPHSQELDSQDLGSLDLDSQGLCQELDSHGLCQEVDSQSSLSKSDMTLECL